MGAPLMFHWDGEVMRPLRYFRERAAVQFKLDEVYKLAEIGDRSINSHKHYFACLGEAFKNLPEDVEGQWRDVDDLRKWALTYTEFQDIKRHETKTMREAIAVAKALSEIPVYVRIEFDNTTVIAHYPHSQSFNLMPSQRTFQRSKQQVLDVLARKLGITVEALEEAGRRAA